jgi:WD40 repeat protein
VALCSSTRSQVGITTKDSVAWWKLIRDVEYSALPSGHTGPVFALQVAGLPSSPGNNDENDGGYVFSCSLDNTVRVWDPYDMMCLRLLQEDRSELSAMVSGMREAGPSPSDLKPVSRRVSAHGLPV